MTTSQAPHSGTVSDPAARWRQARAATRAARGDPQAPDVPRPPGPRGLDAWWRFALTRRPPTDVFTAIARSHPHLAYLRLGPEHLYFLNDPDLVVAVYLARARDTIKGRALQQTRAVLGDGLLTSDGEHHLRQRRLVQPAFHRGRITRYAQDMVDVTRQHEAGWSDGTQVDLAVDMSVLTLDIVGRTLFGSDLRGDAADVGRALDEVLETFPVLLLPGAETFMRLPIRPRRRMDRATRDLDHVVGRMVAEHRASGDTGDLLSMLVAAREDGVGMTDAQLRDEVVTLVLAGHETTAMLLTWTWWLLSTHPEAGYELRGELDAVLGGRDPDADDIVRLPLTRAVVAETLRLYPPAWTLGRRLVADIEVDGWVLPRGSQVLASQWVLHRDPRYWADPTSFRPQRWLDTDGGYDENAPGQPRGAYFPFGWGNRRCIGDQFALTEAVLVLATLAQRWEPEVVAGHPVDVAPAVTLRPKHGMPAVLRRRGPGAPPVRSAGGPRDLVTG